MVRYEYINLAISDQHIHPNETFGIERNLAKTFVESINLEDLQPFLPFGVTSEKINVEPFFEVWDYAYNLDLDNWSVFLNEIPANEIIQSYFYNSELANFRATKEYQELVTNRRSDLWEGLLSWIESRIDRHLGHDAYDAVIWGPKFVGWMDLLYGADFIKEIQVKEPLPPIRPDKKIQDKEYEADVLILIDVIQRSVDPFDLLVRSGKNLKTDGLLILCTRSGSGFDILSLRGNSEYIFPMDHIFLPSPKGVGALLDAAGYEILEMATPGLMDIRYIQKAQAKIPKDQYIMRYILSLEDELLFERMQHFLQRNNLSSHLRCIAKKK